MQLSELRTTLRDDYGRYDLVNSDDSDNGANRWINQAVRYLDRLQENPYSVATEHLRILADQVVVEVKNCRAIQEVWLTDSDGDTVRLTQKSIQWLREEYGDEWESYTDLVTDGDFSADTNWTANGNWSIGAGVASHTASGGQELLQQVFSSTMEAGDVYRVRFDVTAWTAGTVTAALGSDTGTGRTATGTYEEDITITSDTSTLSLIADATFAGSIDNVYVYRRIAQGDHLQATGGDLTAGSPQFYGVSQSRRSPTQTSTTELDVVIDGKKGFQGTHFASDFYDYKSIVILPPTDATLDVRVVGTFWPAVLSSDTDKNYWSAQYPMTLLNATVYLLAVREGRKSLALLKHEAIGIDLRTIAWDNNREDYTGDLVMEG